jgi:hypothetical protein
VFHRAEVWVHGPSGALARCVNIAHDRVPNTVVSLAVPVKPLGTSHEGCAAPRITDTPSTG